MSLTPIFESQSLVREVLSDCPWPSLTGDFTNYVQRHVRHFLGLGGDLSSESVICMRVLLRNILQNLVADVARVERCALEDKLYLEQRFGKLGDIVDISGPHSDLHDLYRAVYFVNFKERQLVFKPRSLLVDEAFHNLCSLYFLAPPVPVVTCTDRGWMPFIKASEVDKGASRHLGLVLSLLVALRSSDHHDENFIIGDGWPVFIDMECSFVPEMVYTPLSGGEFNTEATRVLSWAKGFNRKAVYAGIREGQRVVQKKPWPLIEAIEMLRESQMRVVIRQTSFYQSLMNYSFHPDLIIDDGLRHQAVYDQLNRTAPGFERVSEVEAKLICKGIIPKFTYRPDQKFLYAAGRKFNGLIREPGWTLALSSARKY